MIKLPEELKNLTENDKVIYHFDENLDFAEFLIIVDQLPHAKIIKQKDSYFLPYTFKNKYNCLRAEGSVEIRRGKIDFYLDNPYQYRNYTIITIKKEYDNE